MLLVLQGSLEVVTQGWLGLEGLAEVGQEAGLGPRGDVLCQGEDGGDGVHAVYDTAFLADRSLRQGGKSSHATQRVAWICAGCCFQFLGLLQALLKGDATKL